MIIIAARRGDEILAITTAHEHEISAEATDSIYGMKYRACLSIEVDFSAEASSSTADADKSAGRSGLRDSADDAEIAANDCHFNRLAIPLAPCRHIISS